MRAARRQGIYGLFVLLGLFGVLLAGRFLRQALSFLSYMMILGRHEAARQGYGRLHVRCFVDIDSMNFISGTDRLTRGPTLETVADETGVSHALIRQARLDTASASYRRPPDGWRTAISRLARKRAAELVRFGGTT